MAITISTIMLVVAFVAVQLTAVNAFHAPLPLILQTNRQPILVSRGSSASGGFSYSARRPTSPSSTVLHGLFDDDDSEESPNEIPPEIRDEIYQAEANTPAAQGRNQRVIFYILATIAGVTTAFFNAFLSDLRFGDGSPSTDLAYYGFDWVQANFLLSFLFMNKIGGAIGLLGAGLSGTLAEVEIRSRKENAEKIWEEMQRRQSKKESRSAKKQKKRTLARSSKRDMTGKQKKRLSALEELMVDDEPATQAAPVEESSKTVTESADTTTAESKEGGSEGEDGIMGKIAGFYKKADSMAASQALLLNKELEDRGVIDKITDETGLKVVGKEQAAAAAAKKQQEGNKGDEEK